MLKQVLRTYVPFLAFLENDVSFLWPCIYQAPVIVAALPKEGLGGLVPANPSFGMTRTKILKPVLV